MVTPVFSGRSPGGICERGGSKTLVKEPLVKERAACSRFPFVRGDLLAILEHPNPIRYAGQRIFVVQRDDYVYLVPFVEDEETVFLKIIIPSRKATKQYPGDETDDEA